MTQVRRWLCMAAGAGLLISLGGFTAVDRGPGQSTFGQVTLNCVVMSDRSLSDCQVVRENPEGKGFAAYALRAVTTAKINSRRDRQVRVGQRIEFTKWYSQEDQLPEPQAQSAS